MIPIVAKVLVGDVHNEVGILPRAITCTFTLFHRVHQLWRWHVNIKRVYDSKENFAALVTGRVVNILFGQSLILRIAARCVLIAKRIVDYRKQYFSFTKSYYNLADAFYGRYWFLIRRPDVSATSRRPKILSSEEMFFTKVSFMSLQERIRRVWQGALAFLKEGFFLSMRLLDLVESFSLSDSATNESINELFANGIELFKDYLNNRDKVIAKLQEYKPLVMRVLEVSNSTYDFNKISSEV